MGAETGLVFSDVNGLCYFPFRDVSCAFQDVDVEVFWLHVVVGVADSEVVAKWRVGPFVSRVCQVLVETISHHSAGITDVSGVAELAGDLVDGISCVAASREASYAGIARAAASWAWRGLQC